MKYRAISRSLENLLKEIHKDNEVTMAEFTQLQEESDRRWDGVVEELGKNNTLVSFQSAMDVALHLLYLSVEHIKHQEITDFGEALVKDAITAQVETVRAGAELALTQLRVGRNTL
jgi:predicted transcriptional regulator